MGRVIFLLAGLTLCLSLPVEPHEGETITSDTLGYCKALAAQMSSHPMPPNAQILLAEGRSMCERGFVMGGLRRLRLAMMIIHGQTAQP
jgi:hypothetical protein